MPILLLTARDTITTGRRDWTAAPTTTSSSPSISANVLARLRAIIRRGRLPLQPSVLTVGGLRVDLRGRQAFRQDRVIKLTLREFALLELLFVIQGSRGAGGDR